MSEGTKTEISAAKRHIIERPRLTKLLDETNARIILLVAPAGYGKTTLAREWTEHLSVPLVWYDTPPAGSDVSALARGVAERFAASGHEQLGQLQEEVAQLARHRQDPVLFARLIADRAAALPRETLVVIDNYHLVMDEVQPERFIQELTQRLAHRFLITSRLRPTWAAQRLVVYGTVVQIGALDLAMNDTEGAEVLAHANHGDDDRLLALAAGWPAVIGLAALARPNDRSAVEKLIPHALYNFFAEELYDAVPRATRDVLTEVALLVPARPEMLRGTLRCGSKELAEAERRGLLSRDPDGRLSTHPLLREFLVEKLQEREPAELARLAERTVSALIAASQWDRAFLVITQLNRPDLAQMLLGSAYQPLLDQGRVSTLRRWSHFARLSGRDSPIAILVEAEVSLREGALERARTLAEHAALSLRDDDAARAHLVAARASYLLEGVTAISHLSIAASLTTNKTLASEIAWMRLLTAIELDQSREATSALAALAAVTGATAEDQLRIVAGRGQVAALSGGAIRAVAEHRRVCHLLTLVPDAFVRTGFLNGFAYLLTITQEYEEALEVLHRLTVDAEKYSVDFAMGFALPTRAAAENGLRRFSASRRTLDRLSALLSKSEDELNRVNERIQRARMWTGLGDPTHGLDFLQPDLSDHLALGARGEYLAHRALLLVATGSPAEGDRTADRSLELSSRIDVRVPAMFAKVGAQLMMGDVDAPRASHAILQEAIALGNCDGVSFALRALPELGEGLVRFPSGRNHLTRILARSHDKSIGKRLGLDIPDSGRGVRGLTPREQEVYEHLTQGRSNREIATSLFISEATAKVHVRHIFEKLGVRTRAEAAAAHLDTS